MNWLFSKNCTLSLKPDESGKELAGFKSGNALTCTANYGETVSEVLARFNTYRGPDQQIRKVWTLDGRELPLLTVIHKDIVAIVKK